jgi:hypothetical protein
MVRFAVNADTLFQILEHPDDLVVDHRLGEIDDSEIPQETAHVEHVDSPEKRRR